MASVQFPSRSEQLRIRLLHDNGIACCDYGKGRFTVCGDFDSYSQPGWQLQIRTKDFIRLDWAVEKGVKAIVCESAHLYSRPSDSVPLSKSQPLAASAAEILGSNAKRLGITIYAVPHTQTAKSRRMAAEDFDFDGQPGAAGCFVIGRDKIRKGSPNKKCDVVDARVIHYSLVKHSNVLESMRVWQPQSYEEYRSSNEDTVRLINDLNQQLNRARALEYKNPEPGSDYENYKDSCIDISMSLGKVLAEKYEDDREKLHLLKLIDTRNKGIFDSKYYDKGILVPTRADKLLYTLTACFVTEDGGLRLNGDGKLPYASYVMRRLLGVSPYHLHAGVAASNVKHWSRKTWVSNQIKLRMGYVKNDGAPVAKFPERYPHRKDVTQDPLFKYYRNCHSKIIRDILNDIRYTLLSTELQLGVV